MTFLYLLLHPPTCDEYEQDKKVKFIHIAAWVTAFSMLVFGVLNLKFNAPYTSLAMFLAAGACVLILYLNGIRQDGWASGLLLVVVLFVAFFNLYDGQSLDDPGVIALPIIVVLGSFTFGKKSILPLTTFNLAGIFWLVRLERTGRITPTDLASNDKVLILAILFGVAAILLYAIMDNWEKTLGRARTSEHQLREAVDELTHTRVALEIRVQERTLALAVANEELENFAQSVSHELRAPLRRMAGFAEALMSTCGEEIAPDGQRTLLYIQKAAQRMNALIEGMLSFSRLGRKPLRLQPMSSEDLTYLVQQVFDEVQFSCELPQEIEWKLGPLEPCLADPLLLRQVWANLLCNALKYSQGRTPQRIVVGTTTTLLGEAYFVQDNGAGFDMAYGKKLFQMFERLHSEDEFPGTGVGLATVKRILERHKGFIWAESSPGEGATFYFKIPKPSEFPGAVSE